MVLSYLSNVKEGLDGIMEILTNFETLVKNIYKSSNTHRQYLQRKFTKLEREDTYAYKAPWEEDDDDKRQPDFSKIEFKKIDPIRKNVMLTDFLLDIVDNLPTRFVRRTKAKKGEDKKEIKYLDEFELERAANILVELSSPIYQSYMSNPLSFFTEVSDIIKEYHMIVKELFPAFKDFAGPLTESMIVGGEQFKEVFDDGVFDPKTICTRLEKMNYFGIMPFEEDIQPLTAVEKEHFSARKELLEHLVVSIDKIVKENDGDKKYKLAEKAVEKAVELKEVAKKALFTPHKQKLKQDIREENYFYIAMPQQLGAIEFVREAAPKVKMEHVFGASFDAMKQHIEDLAEYSRLMSLWGATAPDGRVRSNLIAIGPLGCGKTEMARAIAGDKQFAGAEINITDLLTAYFGEFEKNVERVYNGALKIQRDTGKVLFLIMDEFDSWFNYQSEGHWVDSTYTRVQKALQIKLDGVTDYEGIVVLGMTNEPSKIPLAIYRRVKYIDIVGRLIPQERADLLYYFVNRGLPLSDGFTKKMFYNWGVQFGEAPGDVIRKAVDEVHQEFMRKFAKKQGKKAEKLANYVTSQRVEGKEADMEYLKKELGKHMLVTPDWLDRAIKAKLEDAIVREQIEDAIRVYDHAERVMEDLYGRRKPKAGFMTNNGSHNGKQVVTAREKKLRK